MRELDELLGHYLDSGYDQATQVEKDWFREFLTLPDPELARYLLRGEEIADGVAAHVILQIRSRAVPGSPAS